MSRKRKAQDIILPVQSKRSENVVTVAVDVPRAPLSAFAAARARAIITNPDSADIQSQHEPIQSSQLQEPKAPQSKESKRSKSSRKKDKKAITRQDETIDSDDIFSRLPASSKYPMPEPPEFWDPTQDYLSDDPSLPESQDTKEAAPLEVLDTAQTVRFSTWAPTKHNVISSTSKSDRFYMSSGETLSILGQYRVQVHDGLITILGAFLAEGTAAIDVCGPSTSSLPVIKCISSEGAEIELFQIKRTERALDVLDRLSPLYTSIWGSLHNPQSSFFKVLDSEEQPKNGLLPLETPAAWQLCINTLCRHRLKPIPTIQLCGPANVGKSTFGTLLINSLLTIPQSSNWPRSVAFIDLDQNKQEFSPPGQISLVLVKKPILEPRFARPPCIEGAYVVVRAHAVGLNGHKEDMAHYLKAVRDLLQHYHSIAAESSHGWPLVINCPAWYQGSGIDLTINLTEILNTSHVLCFAQGPMKVLQNIQNAAGSTRVDSLPPQPFLNARTARTAAEMNEMQLLSYYHSVSDDKKRPSWDATPLAHRRPFHVLYGRNLCEFAGVFIFGEVPVMYPNMLSTLLNGSIVSLIAIEDATAFEGRKILRGEGDNIPYFAAGSKGYTMPFDPHKSRVVGQALIRGIDAKTQAAQILSPVSSKQIAEVPCDRLVLAFGALECPGWAYLEEKYYQEWAKGKDVDIVGSGIAAPWVEEVGGDEDGRRQVMGSGMQVWKTRRFQ